MRSLPPSDEFLDAPIDPRLVAWLTKWEENRIGHMEWLENVIEEFPLKKNRGERVGVVGRGGDHGLRHIGWPGRGCPEWHVRRV
jgi:hypothetical protein